MFAAEFGTGEVFLSMLYFFLFVIWIWLLISVFTDIFRSHDMSGWAKAAWAVFVIVLPYIGVFAYLIARGGKMAEHAAAETHRRDQAFRSYVRDAAAEPGAPGPADQLSKLASLRNEGVIDDTEFQRLKARITAA